MGGRWERDGREMGERWERDGREMGESAHLKGPSSRGNSRSEK
jgi:hypothetical protein